MIEAFEVALDWTRELIGTTAVLSVVTVVFVVALIAEVFTLAYLAATAPRGSNG